ncbi:MAG: crossover junction endodeoxyribonuclease RuvC [Thermodesulfobacteriota bacterium]
MKILGIDPGSRITGFGVVSSGAGGKLVRVTDGEIRTKAGTPLSERLKVIYNGLTAIIAEYSPEAISVESVFYGKNVKSAMVQSHARGVALLSAAEAAIEVFEYSPAIIKQAVVGNGQATKDQVQHMVKLLLGSGEFSSHDAADALAAAICHINHQGPLNIASDRVSG